MTEANKAPTGSVAKRIVPLFGVLLLITTAGTGGGDEVAQGRAIYLQYCASCHGLGANGDGPMAPTLSIPPANLRKLSERYGNPLPIDQIARFIDGRTVVKAHGPRDMPVWGRRFYPQAQGSEPQIKVLIAELVDYLQSIQAAAGKTSRQEGKGSPQLSDRAMRSCRWRKNMDPPAICGAAQAAEAIASLIISRGDCVDNTRRLD